MSLTPSLPNTTSSSPVPVVVLLFLFLLLLLVVMVEVISIEFKSGLIIGMVDKSGLSKSSDLRRKSESGDCSILSHAVHSSPETELEKEKPLKMGEMGDADPGEGAESVVSSAALQSSIEL